MPHDVGNNRPTHNRNNTTKNCRIADTTETAIAKHLGARIRMVRIEAGLTHAQIATALGATAAEIERHEGGTERIKSWRIFELSRVLGVSIGTLFADTTSRRPEPRAEDQADAAESGPVELGPLKPREVAALVTSFQRIPDRAVRAALMKFIQSLVPASAAPSQAALTRRPEPIFTTLATMSEAEDDRISYASRQ